MLSVEEYNAKYAKTIDFEKGIDNKTFGNAIIEFFLPGNITPKPKDIRAKRC